MQFPPPHGKQMGGASEEPRQGARGEFEKIYEDMTDLGSWKEASGAGVWRTVRGTILRNRDNGHRATSAEPVPSVAQSHRLCSAKPQDLEERRMRRREFGSVWPRLACHVWALICALTLPHYFHLLPLWLRATLSLWLRATESTGYALVEILRPTNLLHLGFKSRRHSASPRCYELFRVLAL
jgi:hypothetical protein